MDSRCRATAENRPLSTRLHHNHAPLGTAGWCPILSQHSELAHCWQPIRPPKRAMAAQGLKPTITLDSSLLPNRLHDRHFGEEHLFSQNVVDRSQPCNTNFKSNFHIRRFGDAKATYLPQLEYGELLLRPTFLCGFKQKLCHQTRPPNRGHYMKPIQRMHFLWANNSKLPHN